MEQDKASVSDADLNEILSAGRLLMKDCALQPDFAESGQAERTEWNRGGVVPTVYLNATSGTPAQRMGKILRNFKSLG